MLVAEIVYGLYVSVVYSDGTLAVECRLQPILLRRWLL